MGGKTALVDLACPQTGPLSAVLGRTIMPMIRFYHTWHWYFKLKTIKKTGRGRTQGKCGREVWKGKEGGREVRVRVCVGGGVGENQYYALYPSFCCKDLLKNTYSLLTTERNGTIYMHIHVHTHIASCMFDSMVQDHFIQAVQLVN